MTKWERPALMFGDLIAKLDQPEIAVAVLSRLDASLVAEIDRQAAAALMTPADFAAGAVREFVEHGGDEL
jgi:hypothetical protein